MIASLMGQVTGKGKDFVILEVNGVGFRVHVPRRLLSTLDPAGQLLRVHTHLHVRENELTLYGCATEEELALFHLLTTVTGIGPKGAMSILSELSPEELLRAIAYEEDGVLAHVPGIGLKTAKKIVFHLKDKVSVDETAALVSRGERAWESEVIAALTALGYNMSEARAAVAAIPAPTTEFEERLRLALRYFAR